MSNKVAATYHPSNPKKPHQIIINHPTGRTTTQQCRTLRDAQMFLGMALLDNGYVKTKREAQALANAQPFVVVHAGDAIAVIEPGGTPC